MDSSSNPNSNPQSPNSSSAPSQPSGKFKKPLKIFAIVISSLLIFLVATLIALPSLLSSQWGQRQLLSFVNERIPGHLSAQNLSISWFGNQVIEGFELKDPEGKQTLSFSRLSTETPLFHLLRTTPKLGKTELSALHATLYQDEHGVTNLERSLAKSPKKTPSTSSSTSIHLPFKGNVEVREGEIQMMPYQGEYIEISSVNAQIHIPQTSDALVVELSGLTRQGQLAGNFEVHAVLNGFNPQGIFELKRNEKGIPQTDHNGQLELQAKVTNFPVEVLDELAAMSYPSAAGLLKAALGDHLNLSLSQSFSNRGLLLNVLVDSPNFQADLAGTLSEKGEFTLSKPGNVHLTVIPPFLELALKQIAPDWRLMTPAGVDLTVDRFSIPLNFSEKDNIVDIAKMDFQARLGVSPVQLKSLQQTYVLQNTSASLHYLRGDQNLVVKLGSELHYGQWVSRIHLDGHWDHLLSREPVDGSFLFSFNDLPTLLVDQLAQSHGMLIDGIGEKINADVDVSISQGNVLASLSVQSQRISVDHLRLSVKERMILEKPTEIHWEASPMIVNRFLPDDWRGQSGIPLVLKIQELSLPFPKEKGGGIQPEQVFVEAALQVDPITLSHLPTGQGYRLSGLQAHIEGDSLASLHASLEGHLESLNPESLFSIAWGNLTHLQAKTTLAVSHEGFLDLDDLMIKADSELGHLVLNGRIRDSKQFSLTKTGLLNYTLTPVTLQKLSHASEGGLSLNAPASIQFFMDQLKTTLDQDLLSNLQLDGKIRLEKLLIGSGPEVSQKTTVASVQQMEIPLAISGPNNSARLNLTAKTTLSQQGKQGGLSAALSLNQWHRQGVLAFSKLIVDSKISLQGFPVSILGALSGQSELVNLFGDSVDMELNTQLDAYQNAREKTGGKLEFKLYGDQLQGSALLRISDVITLFDPNSPAQIHWTMTPEKFAALRKILQQTENELSLSESTTIDASVNSLNLPWLEKTMVTKRDEEGQSASAAQYQLRDRLGLLMAGISADLSINRLGVENHRTLQKMQFEMIKTHLESQNISLKVDLQFSASEKDGYAVQGGNKSDFSLQGSFEHLLDRVGGLNTRDLSMNLQAVGHQLPIVMLCNVACLDNKLQEQIDALIGDVVDFQIDASLKQMEGHVKTSLQGSNGRLSFDGQLQNGYLQLNQPLVAEVNVTPKLSKSLLEDLVPFLSSAISSEKPIQIVIDPEGFVFPIRNFDLNEISIGQSKLDLGKIQFSQQGQLGQILALLKATVHSPSEHLNVWFTPLYVGMKNGVVKLRRMDMLAMDKYPLAIWGKIDFVKDKVRLNVGLSAATLSHAFSIKGLKSDAMLVLPLSGSLDNASIDKGKALTKISALIAQNQGGTKGMLVGGVLEMIGGGIGDDKVPEPTTNPLPWNLSEEDKGDKGGQQGNGSMPQEAFGDSEADQGPQQQSEQPLSPQEKKRKKTLEKIQKGASTLLNILK